MPQPNWETVPPRDWAEEQAHRVAIEIRRLRGKRSAQWVSERTKALGCAVSRTVISDLEVGRRRYVTTAELVVLAVALDTVPVALMYPAPYFEGVRAMPNLDVPKIWAVQWFSGLLRTIANVPFDDESRIILVPLAGAYSDNLRALQRARLAFRLEEQRYALARELGQARQLQDENLKQFSEEELTALLENIADLQSQIDELRDLGGAPQGSDSDGG